ncbi:MAG: biotin transporter BioY [Myxococcota bacterium]
MGQTTKQQTAGSGSVSLPVALPLFHAQTWFQTPALALGGSLVLAASAQVEVPLWPVPFTMHTLAVMVLGLVCSPRVAVAATIAYVLEGCVGLPVFSGFSGGARIMLGPTSGYIVGFIPQALIIALVAQACRGRQYELFGQAAGIVVGQAVQYACGVALLSGLIGVQAAVTTGLLPFLPTFPIKLALALMIARGYGAWARRSLASSTRPAAA